MKVNPSKPIDASDLPIYLPYLEGVREVVGRKPRAISRWLNAASFDLTSDQVLTIRELPGIEKLSRVARRHHIEPPVEEVEPEDPPALPRRDYDFDYGSSLRQNEFINAPEMHDRGYLGQGVVIGITDAGFNNLDHECFEELEVLNTWDFVNDDEDVGDGDDEGDGSHGTKTLSVLAGLAEGHLIGIAPRAAYVLAKTENTEIEQLVEEDYWVEGVEWLDREGVDIISVSLGYRNAYEFEDLDGDHGITTVIADRAAAVGIVVVASMGNRGRGEHPDNKMGTPADGDSVFSIGATNRDSSRAPFSSIGPTYDNRIKPDFSSYGVSVRHASPINDDGYAISSGTSFSAPAIAGLCALLLQANMNLTPIEIRSVLREVSSLSDEPDTLLGWGVPDGFAALRQIAPGMSSLVVPLMEGWNTISSNVALMNPDIAAVFEPLILQDNLVIVKNSIGEIFYPAWALDEIITWEIGEGYQVKTVGADTLELAGPRQPANRPLELQEGWQIVSYFPNFELPVREAFRSLTDQNVLIIARDEMGGFFVPEFDFNIMQSLRPGRGYFVNVTEDIELEYPRRRIGLLDGGLQHFSRYFEQPPPGEFCRNIILTAGDAIQSGDEIAVKDLAGHILGSGVFYDGLAGITIWDVDESVLIEDLGLILRKPDGTFIEPENLSITHVWGFIGDNGYSVFNLNMNTSTNTGTTAEFKLHVAPNPFNDRVNITYTDLDLGEIEFAVYNIHGIRVATKFVAGKSTSSRKVTFRANEWPSGVYIITAECMGSVTRLKVIHTR